MASRGALVAPVLTALVLSAIPLASAVAAPDDDERIAAIQVELVRSRHDVNGLYAAAAAAAEQFNGAVVAAEEAERELNDLDTRIAAAERELDVERSAVEALTMEQLTGQRPTAVLQALLDAESPTQLLERSSAYASAQDAFAGQIARLEARQAVVRSVRQRAAEAAARRRSAVRQQTSTRREIERTLATAQRRHEHLVTERAGLLRELAALERSTVAAVTARQNRIDEQIDARQAEPPAPARPAAPAPAPVPSAPPSPVPAPNPSRVEAMIGYAQAQLGKPYGWGAAGPGAFDCSGLTLRALEAAGHRAARTAGAQYAELPGKIRPAERQRGDLLFYREGGQITHVSIYLGSGKMIHAPRPGRTVEIVPVSYWREPDLAARPF